MRHLPTAHSLRRRTQPCPEVQAILQALKTYGMILADNGSDNFISGTHDPRWNADAIGELRRVKTRDLEVVEMTGLVAGDKE